MKLIDYSRYHHADGTQSHTRKALYDDDDKRTGTWIAYAVPEEWQWFPLYKPRVCGKAITLSRNPSYQIPSSLLTNKTDFIPRRLRVHLLLPTQAANAIVESANEDANLPVLFQDWRDYCQSHGDLAPYPLSHLGQALWVAVNRAIDPFVDSHCPSAQHAHPLVSVDLSLVYKRSKCGLLFHW